MATTLGGYKSSVWSVAFSPDGKLLASGSHKESIRVFKVENQEEVFPSPPVEEEKPDEE